MLTYRLILHVLTDLTGSADGSVRLYEWGHIQPLAMLRQPGAFPKVTKVLFSSQGNKVNINFHFLIRNLSFVTFQYMNISKFRTSYFKRIHFV